jgi:uncharacterized membrane protein YtjA (UPF0391 family)
MFRWAVICLIVSLIAGGFGLTNISAFANLVGSALDHAELVPALIAISVS